MSVAFAPLSFSLPLTLLGNGRVFQGTAAGSVPFTVQGASGQTANVFQIQNSAGSNLLTVDNSGNLTIAGTATISINEAVVGDLTLTGNLVVNGNGTLGNASSDTLTVVATSSFTAPVSMTGTLDVTGITTTQSLVSTTRLGLRRRGSAPSPLGVQGQLYTRAGAADTTELFYLDPAGNDVQITAGGGLDFDNIAGMMTFTSGEAVTAASYQIGRDADGTNQLHLNVPTGAGYEMSVNDVAFFILTASADGSAAGSIWTYTHTRTDTAAAVRQPFFSDIVFTPAANSATSLVGHTYRLFTSSANDFTSATGLFAWRALFHHGGTGTVTLANAANAGISTGANNITEGYGWAINTPTTTGGIFVTIGGIRVRNQSIAGGTTSYGIVIESQTANATTTRAIELAGTGVNNAIRLGASANLYGQAAETVRISDSTNANGLSVVLTATASQTINTITATTGTLVLQNQTFTAGALHNAVQITPTWVAEDFQHSALSITPTQNGANTSSLFGLRVAMTKATGATTLDAMVAISIGAPTITGTVTTGVGIDIADQSNAGFTGVAAIRMIGSGTSNALVLGNSPRIYSSGANVINFMDSTAVRGITVTLTAAGNQTIAASGGSLALGLMNFTSGATLTRTTSAAGAYAVLTTDIVIAKTGITGGGDTVTLPTVASAGAGKVYIIADESGGASANNITVDGNGAETIDGVASIAIGSNYGVLRLYCTGTAWKTF